MSNPQAVPGESACASNIIDIYQRLARLSGTMRQAALKQRWEDLVEVGKSYVETVQQLRDVPGIEPCSDEERGTRSQLLLEILDNDAVIRDLTQPELARLGTLLTSYGRKRDYLKSYSDVHASRLE